MPINYNYIPQISHWNRNSIMVGHLISILSMSLYEVPGHGPWAVCGIAFHRVQLEENLPWG